METFLLDPEKTDDFWVEGEMHTSGEAAPSSSHKGDMTDTEIVIE